MKHINFDEPVGCFLMLLGLVVVILAAGVPAAAEQLTERRHAMKKEKIPYWVMLLLQAVAVMATVCLIKWMLR